MNSYGGDAVRTINVYISNFNFYYTTSIRTILNLHFVAMETEVSYTSDIQKLPYCDVAFLSPEIMLAHELSDANILNENISKIIVILSQKRFTIFPKNTKWILGIHHTPQDLLVLTEHILGIRQSDVDKHIMHYIAQSSFYRFTPRQQDVIKLMLKEVTPSRISTSLNISEKTVSSHKRSIMKKFNLNRPIDLFYWLKIYKKFYLS